MRIYLLSKLHVSDSNVVCSEGDADLHRVGPDVSTDAVLQRLVYNCYKRKTNLIGLNGQKSKKARKQTPPKIQFYLLGGVFSPVFNTYTPCIHLHIILVSGIYCKCLLHGIKY